MNAPAVDLPWSDWIVQQRWYAGRNRTLRTAALGQVIALCDGLDLVILEVDYTDESMERYQVLVSWDFNPAAEYSAVAKIGAHDGQAAYDGLFAPDACRDVLSLIDSSAVRGPDSGQVRFVGEPDVSLPLRAHPQVMGAEQSNTSVIFGHDAIFKAFRRITNGTNPDIELNCALGRSGNQHVARLLGSYQATLPDGNQYPLGLVSAYAADTDDGWDLATASVRDLITGGGADTSAGGAGGGFTGEAYRLGRAVASVHAELTETLGAQQPGRAGRRHGGAAALDCGGSAGDQAPC